MQRTGFDNARVRQANKSIFLSHLWREKQLSKSQLSQLTGLSIPAVSNILAELLSEGLIGHSTEHLSKRGVNSGSYQIPEHGAWTLCMNITPTSIEYQLADAACWQWMVISICRSTRPLLRPCLRPSLNAGGISTAATRSTASISPLACMDRLIRLPAFHKPCPRHAGKHRSK